MYHIYGKKIILSVLLSVYFTLSSYGQGFLKGNYNFKGFQQKSYYFGLTLGVNTASFHLDRSSTFIGNENIKIIEAKNGIGFNLNMIGNLKLGQNFDFRFLPGFTFTEQVVQYTNPATDAIEPESLENVFFDIPFHVRFKSAPYKDKRVFVIGGIRYSYDVASNRDNKRSILRFSPHDFLYEVGLGMQFFYPYFIFSPEIKFSRGLTNSLIYDNAVEKSQVLENTVTQYITLSFHFEG